MNLTSIFSVTNLLVQKKKTFLVAKFHRVNESLFLDNFYLLVCRNKFDIGLPWQVSFFENCHFFFFFNKEDLSLSRVLAKKMTFISWLNHFAQKGVLVVFKCLSSPQTMVHGKRDLGTRFRGFKMPERTTEAFGGSPNSDVLVLMG